MTSGGIAVTNGGWRVSLVPWAIVVAVGLAGIAVNISSLILEAQREGVDRPAYVPFVLEITSYVAIVALAPIVGWAIAWFPPRREAAVRFVLVHAALTIPFSFAHVGLMVAMREVAFAFAGRDYGYLDDGLAFPLFYEWRKDVLAYVLFAAIYWLFQRRPQVRDKQPPANAEKIELRDGATVTYLVPSDVLFVEAAGNYVEFHTTKQSHMVRGTLASWSERLRELGIVRVHRSRLVNRARIGRISPTSSGDFEITLDNARTVVGSRRFRTMLEPMGDSPNS